MPPDIIIETDKKKIKAYQADERKPQLDHVLTAKNIETSDRFRHQVLEGNPDNPVMWELKTISEYGRTCLAVGCADGPQFFGLRKFYPKIEWAGCEISQNYLNLFRRALKEERVIDTPSIVKVDDYRDLSVFADNSFEVVCPGSTLSHYSPEHGFQIIDEMLRIASKAVVIKFKRPIEEENDVYVKGFANMSGRGYFVFWAKSKWDKYTQGKKVIKYSDFIYIILK